ncbi:hypothetical protein BHM03_00015473 [Ensete ventricosum]|nr:hypothetical protein BHM03_00015473 [Ensete ventricosum]
MSRRQGDWDCRSCRHHNFSWRDSCQQCGNLRPTTGDLSDYAGLGRPSVGFSVPSFRPGDWKCSCGGHNFASRTSCHSCGTSKDDSAINVSLGLDNNDMPGSGGKLDRAAALLLHGYVSVYVCVKEEMLCSFYLVLPTCENSFAMGIPHRLIRKSHIN